MLRKAAALLSIAICFTWTCAASAQVIGSGISGDAKAAAAYTCTASANFLTRSDVVAAVAAIPSGQAAELAAWNADIQTLICNGTTDGWLPLTDVFYEFAAPSKTIALLNIGAAGAAYDGTLTALNSSPILMLFTPEVGFTGAQNILGPLLNNNHAYLTTGYNPGAGSGGPYNLTTNSASVGICDLNYRRGTVVNVASLASEVAGGSASYTVVTVGQAISGGGQTTQYAVNVAGGGFASSNSNSNGALGQWLFDRSSSSLTSAYEGGAAFGTTSIASVALASSTFVIGVTNIAGVIGTAGFETYSNFSAGASLGTTASAGPIVGYFADTHAYNVNRGLFGC